VSDGTVRPVIALPQGGGAMSGIGEKFSPDLHTGTGNFTVPIAVPPGRNGLQPQLELVYSTGNGNGPFGLGWSLSIPGVSRKTSDGVPRHNERAPELDPGERRDVFVLSGVEDLVPVLGSYPGAVQYRPRTEGLFARITHRPGQAPEDDDWQVESKDGLVSIYGRPHPAAAGPATIRMPDDPSRIHAWKLTQTRDLHGNLVVYEYERDPGAQLLLRRIRYVDYGDPAAPEFLVSIDLQYEDRPDPFSNCRAGFEIRTTRRCREIKVATRTSDGRVHPVRDYRLGYAIDPFNGVSLLRQLDVVGYDDDGNPYGDDDPESQFAKLLPPLTFGYTPFDPAGRKFGLVEGRELPARGLRAPDMALVDLHGSGLPDLVETSGLVRYWRNLGDGRFDTPRPMADAPPHALADPGVQLIDANGDGRPDLLVTTGLAAGYFPLVHGARWDLRSFQPYRQVPSFALTDPEVRLIDLDGDGITDVLRSGSRMQAFFNHRDPALAWARHRYTERRALAEFPDVSFSDPRVRLADMTGDGLQDVVLVHDGLVEYWPNLGYNCWGPRVTMRDGPRFPYGYDPRRLLLGDVDGDGVADLIYVDHGRVYLWINRSGNGWTPQPVEIVGTPPVSDQDSVQLVDLNGTGVSGVLWSSDATGRHQMAFLDFTGGRKPYVLDEMDNHMGAVTRVEYRPSTWYYLEDERTASTRWRTPLPFPVQVVARVEVIDEVSRGKLNTVYRYHHGYWDGAEREFRGFGQVEQRDTETFADYHAAGLNGDEDAFEPVRQFSPPMLTRTWFHQGPVGEEHGDWSETDHSGEFWSGDPQLLGHVDRTNGFLGRYDDQGIGRRPSPLGRRARRDALRTLRGNVLRSERYALDGSARQDRPYTVTEHAYALEVVDEPALGSDRPHVFFPHLESQRTTRWERGDDPMTAFSFTGDFDAFGQPRQQTAVAMPRLRRHRGAINGAAIAPFDPNETRVLATHARTAYAEAPGDRHIRDRVAQVKRWELVDPPPGPDDRADSLAAALRRQWVLAGQVRDRLVAGAAGDVRVFGHEVHHYDGPDFEGEAVGTLGPRGALVRTEALVSADRLLADAYTTPDEDRRPDYLGGTAGRGGAGPAGFGADLGYRRAVADARGYEDGLYADALRQRLSPRGLPLATQDALQRETVITYDEHDLLPVSVVDTLGLETRATYDPRLLLPDSMIEPNGHSTHVRYSPIGLPLDQRVVGLDAQGAPTLGGTPERPELSFAYDFRAFERSKALTGFGSPISVRSARRVHHASDGLSDDTIEAREYSDGFGRLIQTRAQAEDLVFGARGDAVGLPADLDAATSPAVGTTALDRVVVSGWQVFDNKGQVVERVEPFFSRGWEFKREDAATNGQRVTMFYDPRGNVVRTLYPDGSQQRIVPGRPLDAEALALDADGLASTDVPAGFEPTPWETYSYDANDLAGLTHPGEQEVPARHRFTPGSGVVDALGRVLCAVARNGPVPAEDWFVTRSSYDVRGNLLAVTDALGRTAFEYRYDLLDRALVVDSLDAGRRSSVYDALGNLIERRDSRRSLVLRTYDAANRPRELWAREGADGALTLRERLHYGDDDRASAQGHNTLGRVVRHYDEAGLLETPDYDFKGNLLEKSRRTIRDEALAEDWTADWSAAGAEDALEARTHRTSSRYDALNRPIELTFPEDVDLERKRLLPRYNRAGALEAVRLGDDTYVEHIAYNARGQRVHVAYGNGLMTRHAYDERTFRLARRYSERCVQVEDAATGARTWSGEGPAIQDLGYAYDLAGNPTRIVDRAPNSGTLGPLGEGRHRLTRRFQYDAIYRLIEATGRACQDIGAPRGSGDDPRCGAYAGGPAVPNQDNAPELTERYTERFRYDPAGNLLALSYSADSGGWVRRFGMSGFTPRQWLEKLAAADWGRESNRLTSMGNEDQAPNYVFDANGNLLRQDLDKRHTWDHADRMRTFRVQANDAAPPSIQARYLYGADGTRVKKWVRSQGGAVNTTTYVDGAFEVHRRIEGGVARENDTLHVMDGQSRVALVRVGLALDARDVSPRVQYHLGDHLGSSHVVVGGDDSTANAFIQREEYFPYGETSFGSFGRKRYRYSGKERDEESGLYYYGARYLAPWLGRWVSADPAGLVDGPNLYSGFLSNPIKFVDDRGHAADQPDPDRQKLESLKQEVAASGVVPSDRPLEAERRRLNDLDAKLREANAGVSQAEESLREAIATHGGDLRSDEVRDAGRDLGERRRKAAIIQAEFDASKEVVEAFDAPGSSSTIDDDFGTETQESLEEARRASSSPELTVEELSDANWKAGVFDGDVVPHRPGTAAFGPKDIPGKVLGRTVDIVGDIAKRAAGPVKIILVTLAVNDAIGQWRDYGILKGTIFNIADYVPYVSAAKGIAEGVVDVVELGWDVYDHYKYDIEIQ